MTFPLHQRMPWRSIHHQRSYFTTATASLRLHAAHCRPPKVLPSVKLSRHVLRLWWSHRWWKVVPSERMLYINKRNSHKRLRFRRFCEHRLVVCWAKSLSWRIEFDSRRLQWSVFSLHVKKFWKSENYKNLKEFWKINLIILMNRLNRVNRKKSQNRLRWGWVCFERTWILSGIQFTTHFIEFFVVETKRFVGSSSYVNVILTRQTCGQRSSRAAKRKRQALGNDFSERICYMFLISKFRGDWDPGLCTTSVLRLRLENRSAVATSGKKMCFDAGKIEFCQWFPSARRLLSTALLKHWPQVCRVKICLFVCLFVCWNHVYNKPLTFNKFLSINFLEFADIFLSWLLSTVQEVKAFLIQHVKNFVCGDHPLGGGNENSEYRHVATKFDVSHFHCHGRVVACDWFLWDTGVG